MSDKTLSQQANDELMRELMQREMASKVMPQSGALFSEAGLVPNTSQPMTPMSPGVAQLAGALGDAASTYSFLKRGTGVEDNAAYRGADNQPLATAVPVAVDGLMNLVGRALLNKTGNHTLKQLADLVMAMQGSHQIGLAAQNFSHDFGGGFGPGANSEREVNQKVLDAVTRR